jgi:hypothetical protein
MRLVGWLMLCVCLAVAGCTGDCSNCVTVTDSGVCTTCVPDGGRFSIFVVDGTFFTPDGGGGAQSNVVGFETIPLFQMQLAPSGNIGIAYVEYSADQTDFKARPDPEVFNYDINYIEWSNASQSVVLGPERVTGSVPVQNFVGVSLDYQANGEPAVALLGWAPPPGYDGTGGIDGGTSNQAFWFQHTGVVSYRNLNGGGTPGTWTQETAVMDSEQAASSSPACAGDGSCSMGTIVGLYPAVFIDGSETILAYRDVHFGSSSGTGDFDNSNLGVAFGGPTNWSYTGLAWGKPGILLPSGCEGSARTPYGNHNKFIHGDSNNPALISDIGSNEYNSDGTNVLFFERRSNAWNCPLSLLKVGSPTDSPSMQTETGPYLAYDGTPTGQGYAVAVSDINGGGAAYYKNCLPGADCTQLANWGVFQSVYHSGSGGYFASVALNPDTHDPWVAFYVCSTNAGTSVTVCPVSQRQLQVATSVEGIGAWTPEAVDNQGAWQTQMLYLTNPAQLVIGYRDPASGAMKLAVENPGSQ